jgi:hypothetical protein
MIWKESEYGVEELHTKEFYPLARLEICRGVATSYFLRDFKKVFFQRKCDIYNGDTKRTIRDMKQKIEDKL